MKNILKKATPLIILTLLLFLDQITKLLAVNFLKNKPDFPLIPGILEFSYLENTGAAFSSFMGRQGFLILLTTLVMAFLIWKYMDIPMGRRFFSMRAAFILIISGGIGNLIDRIANRYVVDFIYFVPIDFPKFNMADCYVSIGMVFLIIISFFYYKDDELNFLFNIKTNNNLK